MFDPTIHPQNLARQLRDADFVADQRLLNSAYKENVLERAATIGIHGFTSVSIKENKLRGKSIFGITHLGQLLILRHITLNIKRATHAKTR